MIGKIRQHVRGIALWIRYGPSRLLAALAGHTRLPEGFWVVAVVSVVAGALTALLAVTVTYRYVNRPEPPRRVD